MIRERNVSTKDLFIFLYVYYNFFHQILSDFDTDTRSCVSYSMSDLSPGDEFRIFYGPRGNGELILNQVREMFIAHLSSK